ncbi:histidine kinase [Chryseolinea sp. T2]|uniref:sensor histidine kinase n=1 Tax=Chryseolinea sp. T2 TaxID=3129255 RepID=UPI003077E3CF
MMFKYKVMFWTTLGLLVFGFFRWLSGIAMPEIANAFAAGTTAVILAGLGVGYILTNLAIRLNAVRSVVRIIFYCAAFIFFGIVVIAFLLNGMIQHTTLFPFAITVMFVFLVNAAVACIVTIIRSQYREKISSARAAVAQSKSELQLLQSQLSPHFLFNTLNNLYGLSMTEPSRLPPLLLKLSDLLRYSVYEVKELFVPLQHEMDYIRNYVDFERLRLGERLQLSFRDDGVVSGGCQIPPLMLIVFVENAFKHSRTAGENMIVIDINLNRSGNQLVFSVQNSVAAGGNELRTERSSGFGLDSVRKRLNLLYPEKHRLTIERKESSHTVYLELECQ